MRKLALVIVAAGFVMAMSGCGNNFLTDTLSGEGVCDDAVRYIEQCCTPQFEGKTDKYAVCTDINTLLKADPEFWASFSDTCQKNGFTFEKRTGGTFDAKDITSVSCDDLLSDLALPGTTRPDGDEVELPEKESERLENEEAEEIEPDVEEEMEIDEDVVDVDEDVVQDKDPDIIELPEVDGDKETVCTPGEILCNEDGNAEICKLDGSGYQVVECKDTNECTQDRCVPGEGCVFDAQTMNGTSCDDGNACSVNDTCQEGMCVGQTRDCMAELPDHIEPQCIDPNTGVGCNPDSGCWFNPATKNGAECDDGDNCTIEDTCNNGVCTGETRDCSEFNSLCAVGVCNPDTGECEADNLPAGTECDDGNACTVGETCDGAGNCVGSDRDCDDHNVCTTDSCDPNSGCINRPDPDMEGESCDDGNACTLQDTCRAGSCIGTEKQWTVDDLPENAEQQCVQSAICDPEDGSFEFVFGGSCEDGSLCTENDFCSIETGACMSGTPKDCSDLDDLPCALGSCNEDTGLCERVPANEGYSCEDGNPCTEGDSCVSGRCEPGNERSCDDNDVCTTDWCDVNDTSGEPCRHDSITCDDGNPCTDDTCDPINGCSSIPVVGRSCDDGLVCNGQNEVCDEDGNCVASESAPDCSYLDDQCVVGVCDEDNSPSYCSVLNRDDGTPCDDGDDATVSDYCSSGVCIAGSSLPAPFAGVDTTEFYRTVYCPYPDRVGSDVHLQMQFSSVDSSSIAIWLESPEGQRWRVFYREPGSGSISIDKFSSVFVGAAASGAWKVLITDYSSNGGQLEGLSIFVPCEGVEYEFESELEAEAEYEVEFEIEADAELDGDVDLEPEIEQELELEEAATDLELDAEIDAEESLEETTFEQDVDVELELESEIDESLSESEVEAEAEIETEDNNYNTTTVHYHTGWNPPYIHYSNGEEWTTVPGVAMTNESGLWWVIYDIAWQGSQFEFVFNDGAGNWDNPPGGGNYITTLSEVWVKDGVIYDSNPDASVDGDSEAESEAEAEEEVAPVAPEVGDLVINEVLYDPPTDNTLGDANGDGTRDATDDEFVEIVNISGHALNLSGVTLHDNQGLIFAFPEDTILECGQAAVVFGGGNPTGDFGGALVFASSSWGGLGNSGDGVHIYLSDGTTVADSMTYSSGDGSDVALVRSPELDLSAPFVMHTNLNADKLFSPGTHADGSAFVCVP